MKTDIGIHFTITIFIWLVSWTDAIEISHSELNDNPNKTCLQQSSCMGIDRNAAAAAAVINVAAVNNVTAYESDGGNARGNRRNCLCDDRCVAYGDCCTDWVSFDPVEQQIAAARYSCIPSSSGGVYAVAKCPDTWTSDPGVKDACETPGDFGRYGMLGNPVTSRSTGQTYLNRFCAVCNGDATDSVVWNVLLNCEELSVGANETEQVSDSLRRKPDGQWTVEYRGEQHSCGLATVPPIAVSARPCWPNVVSTCQPNWRAAEVRSNCEAYTTIVYNGNQPYKNAHCAICNNVRVQDLRCNVSEIDIRLWNPNQLGLRSFSTLFSAQPDHRKCLGDDKFYDSLNKTCRPLVPTANGVSLSCLDVAVYPVAPTDWKPFNGSVEYVTLDNGTLVACAPKLTLNSEAFGSAVITYVGLGVSVVFLIVHLVVFAVLPEMKNLSGKNLASFCVSLVCAYAAFVSGNWLSGPACRAVAALTYYAFLTSFVWMLVMSFDCWRTLRLATVKLRIAKGRQTRKFLVYSAVSWLVPAMLTFVAVAADTVPAVPEQFRPRFGVDQCWFGSKTALLAFFVGPLAAIMTVNFVMFAWIAYMIQSSRLTMRHINTRHVRRDFRMYCRLAVLMGLTWTTGILASYTDKKYLWVVFVVLNTFQGLFVFVAFTCRRRVLDSLVGGGHKNDDDAYDPEKDNNNKNLRPTPLTSSFSWSSTNDDAPVVVGGGGGDSEKTSDTLY